ncbi:TonB-dependent receptor [Aquirufa sp. HETE-40SA]
MRAFIIIGLFISYTSFSQTQNIRGRLLDKYIQQPIFLADIYLSPGNQVVKSDSLGYFAFSNLPLSSYQIRVRALGYEEFSVPKIELIAGKESYLALEMEEKPIFLQEVRVQAEKSKEVAKNEFTLVSARQFSLLEAQRYAGGFQDPARMALNFAGVTNAGSDQNNEIIIRGNSPKGLLWRMEGIEIPNPNHFGDGQGSTSGIISMINSTSLANSDFMSGAFPAEYGNASSGVFDLSLQRGNNQKKEWMTTLSVVGLDVAGEGPLGNKGGSYRVGLRYSTLEILLKSGLVNINTGNFKPAYRDLNYLIELPTKKSGTFTLWGIAGANNTEDIKTTTSDFTNSQVVVGGLSHKLPVKSGHIKTVLAYTTESTEIIQETRSVTTREQTYQYPTWRLNSYYLHRFNSTAQLKIGVNASQLGYNLYEFRNKIIYLNDKDKTYYWQQYIQFQKKWTSQLSMTAGVHRYEFELNKAQGWEPRLSVLWETKSGGRLGLGLGVHSRLDPLSLYFYKRYTGSTSKLPNMNIRPAVSLHQVISYDQRIGENTRLKLEAYVQNISQAPVDSNRNSPFSLLNYSSGIPTQVLENSGIGENKGIELTLERFLSNDFYFLITASVFDTKFQAKKNVWYNTQFNNNYAANVLVGKDFRQKFSVNLRYLIRGGNRYTPINLTESIKRNTTVLTSSQLMQAQYPTFQRLDLSVAYKLNRAKHTWTIRADLQNILDIANVIEERYDSNAKALTYRYALPLIPILSTRVDF